MTAGRYVRVRAPAKVNLTLFVLGRRPDGYHDIESWVAPIDLADALTLEASPGPEPELTCDDAALPAGDANLAIRAARALATAAGRPPSVRITLEKRIPVGGGLGGGSSDAAAVLVGLARLWRLDWPADRLMRIGAEIGSDVPLFVAGRQCLIRGRGERVEPLERAWSGWLVLIAPPFGTSTAAVYAACRPAESGQARPDVAALAGGPAERIRAAMVNELEAAAFRVEPRLAELHGRVDGLESAAVRLSGSGSTLFTIFDDRVAASRWQAAAARRLGPEVRTFVCSTWPTEPAPVQGEPRHGNH